MKPKNNEIHSSQLIHSKFKNKKTLKAFNELLKKHNLDEVKLSELEGLDLTLIQNIKKFSEKI